MQEVTSFYRKTMHKNKLNVLKSPQTDTVIDFAVKMVHLNVNNFPTAFLRETQVKPVGIDRDLYALSYCIAFAVSVFLFIAIIWVCI